MIRLAMAAAMLCMQCTLLPAAGAAEIAADATNACSHSGGRARALAMSTLFTTLVLMPFPRPSILATSLGIL
jgi:hypothetical protein